MNRFLFVCTANWQRSPTAEHVARLMGFPSDSAGCGECDPVPLTREAIARAQHIVCMEPQHAQAVMTLAPERVMDITVWNIPDTYDYCDPKLIRLIRERLTAEL